MYTVAKKIKIRPLLDITAPVRKSRKLQNKVYPYMCYPEYSNITKYNKSL